MEDEKILIYILSFGMSVVLLLTIVALTYIIKLLKSLRSIGEKADHIATNVNSASEFVKNTAGPAAVAKFITNAYQSARSNQGKGKK